METSMQEIIADSVRMRRKALGMSQRDLAHAVGFRSHQIISDLERGLRDVKAWELARIAQVLHTRLPELMGLPSSAPTDVHVFWRLTAATVDRPEREARLVERLRRYRRVEELVGAVGHGESLPQYRLERNASFGHVQRMASRARRDLDLGGRPALSMSETLEERFGVRIFLDDLGDGESAACLRTRGDAAVVLNRNEAAWRQRFSLAHELFHLVTWDAVLGNPTGGNLSAAWSERLEKLANVFASALLLPGDDLRAEVQTSLEGLGGSESADLVLVNLARSYGVSVDALMWRLCGLGLVREKAVREKLINPVFRGLDRASRTGRRTKPASDLPERLTRLVSLAYQAGELSRTTAARYLERNPGELHFLDWDDGDGWSGEAGPA